MMKEAAILGTGSWGTALGVVLADRGLDVLMYGKSREHADDINQNSRNSYYLPGIDLPENLTATVEIEDVVDKPLILLVVPSQVAREVLTKLKKAGIPKETIILTCNKGIDPSSGHLMQATVHDLFPENPKAVLAGPSHAEEVATRMATAAVIGCEDEILSGKIQEIFTLPYFRTYTSTDVIGIEIGGVVKNIFAIAAGTADGLGLGDNSKAALVTRGLAEMTRLGMAMGGRRETFQGLSGIGDLIVTCYSVHSRNNRVGRLLGQGKTLQEAVNELNQVAEGVPNAKNAYELARKLNVRTPLIDEAYQVLYNDKPCALALKELLSRNPRSEID
jgi:glycerol-3-phosphate dehydrogenase (NAD(P)+)